MLGTFCDKFAASLSGQKADPSLGEILGSFFLLNLLSAPIDFPTQVTHSPLQFWAITLALLNPLQS